MIDREDWLIISCWLY